MDGGDSPLPDCSPFSSLPRHDALIGPPQRPDRGPLFDRHFLEKLTATRQALSQGSLSSLVQAYTNYLLVLTAIIKTAVRLPGSLMARSPDYP